MTELEKLILKMFDVYKSLEAIKHASPEVEEALRLKDEYYALMEEVQRMCGTERQYVPYPVYPTHEPINKPLWDIKILPFTRSTSGEVL